MAQADAVATMLPGYETSVSYEYRGAGIGSSVTVWAKAGDIPIGASAIGRKGVPAAEVGAMAATEFLEVLESGGADPHLPDQSVAFMAMAGSGSIVPLSKKTSHLETVSWVTRQFMPCSISLSDTELAVRPRKEV
jgi:RNA 3'-terminal phosphate cyclase